MQRLRVLAKDKLEVHTGRALNVIARQIGNLLLFFHAVRHRTGTPKCGSYSHKYVDVILRLCRPIAR